MAMPSYAHIFHSIRRQWYEPRPRLWHYAGAVGGKSFIFAGRLRTKEELSSTIECFDHYSEQWKVQKTTSTDHDQPKGLYNGGCCISPSGDLYVYGGLAGSIEHDGLYKLSPCLIWKQLSGKSVGVKCPTDLKKVGCGIACFNENKVAVIGGFAPQPASLQESDGASFIKDKYYTHRHDEANRIHVFDSNESTWSSPTFSGTKPPPTGRFTLTSINEDRALMFGGIDLDQLLRVSDLYLVDFQKMVITKLEGEEGEPWPVGRAAHAACCLGFGSRHPHLLVTGGVDKDNKTMRDAWLFDVTNRRWKEIILPNDALSRYGHSVAAVPLASGLTEVSIFGGASHYEHDHCVRSMAETTILTFECSKSTWQLVDVAKSNQLGTDERIQKKIERIKLFARNTQMSSGDGAEVQDLKDALGKLHQELKEANKKAKLNQQIQLEQWQKKMKYAEVRAREAEAQLDEVQSHWVIPKSDIELTKEKLGKGAWGKVKVAKFRGTRVAAKCYHQILLSEHNCRLFHREITMAARLRHPNLVQFIGASMEGELILLTELMTTSLGALMDRGPLSEANIISISLNVAQALNYLHLIQPHPIIHRDICSGNVLLDPLPDNCWKAKVSDYGSVNLVRHLTTAHPGNPFYAAPESEYPKEQTPKMDIYSFGVLLAEMLTNELPEKKDRHRQILKISVERPKFIELVVLCLSEEGDHRPSAQGIITQFDAW